MAQATQDEEYLRVGRAAALLHVSPQTLTRWAIEDRVQFDVTIGGHRRFPRSEIDRLRRELHGPPPPADLDGGRPSRPG
jgi:excisionase family DNA binding protein